MYFIQFIKFLIFILLNHTLLAFALPAASSTALNATNFHRDIAVGIATAERAYLRPRLYGVNANTINGPQRMPLPFTEATLNFLLIWPTVIEMNNKHLGNAWPPPVEESQGLVFIIPTFNWNQIPMTIEEAQQRVLATRDIPDNIRVFDSVTIVVHNFHHPTLPIRAGDLTFGFFVSETLDYVIYVVATTGGVYVDDYRDDVENAVQTD